jgi:hypothetical protein
MVLSIRPIVRDAADQIERGAQTDGNSTAGNDGKTDATWTAGICTPIGGGSTLPIFCVQQ